MRIILDMAYTPLLIDTQYLFTRPREIRLSVNKKLMIIAGTVEKYRVKLLYQTSILGMCLSICSVKTISS